MDEQLLKRLGSFVARFEGFRAKPYQNPGDRPTIGYGNTFYENGKAVTLKDPAITQDRAQALLNHFLVNCSLHVQELCKQPLTNNQLIALTDFEYNTGALRRASLLVHLNQGDYDSAAEGLLKWVNMGGRPLHALQARREKEKELFLTPDKENT